MENGLTAQLMNRVTPIPRHWLRTCVNAPKSILMALVQINGESEKAVSIAPFIKPKAPHSILPAQPSL